jgi:predicted TIM-barrel fold metal-dependent hydrolase
MYAGHKVLDIHGHMTAPAQFRNYAMTLMTQRNPRNAPLRLSDEQLDGALNRHVRGLDARNIDVQILSQRPVAMLQWEMPHVQAQWCETTNNVIAQSCKLYPERFVGMAQLPQNSQIATSNCVDELERCVKDLNFVGAIVNPDPSGMRDAPGVDREYWYPLYEKAQELDAPLMIHPSITKDPRVVGVPHNYQINNVWEEYLATQLYIHSDVFKTFPRLKIVVCHGGGAISRHFNEDQRTGPTRQEIRERFRDNLFYDTCGYDLDWMTGLIRQKGVDSMVFGTEVGGIGGGEDGEGGGPAREETGGARPRSGGQRENPATGAPPNDVVAIIDHVEGLTTEEKIKIFNTNVKRLYSRLASVVEV